MKIEKQWPQVVIMTKKEWVRYPAKSKTSLNGTRFAKVYIEGKRISLPVKLKGID